MLTLGAQKAEPECPKCSHGTVTVTYNLDIWYMLMLVENYTMLG
jgi:hypothetical protein